MPSKFQSDTFFHFKSYSFFSSSTLFFCLKIVLFLPMEIFYNTWQSFTYLCQCYSNQTNVTDQYQPFHDLLMTTTISLCSQLNDFYTITGQSENCINNNTLYRHNSIVSVKPKPIETQQLHGNWFWMHAFIYWYIHFLIQIIQQHIYKQEKRKMAFLILYVSASINVFPLSQVWLLVSTCCMFYCQQTPVAGQHIHVTVLPPKLTFFT